MSNSSVGVVYCGTSGHQKSLLKSTSIATGARKMVSVSSKAKIAVIVL